MEILFILGMPLVLALVSPVVRHQKACGLINASGHALVLCAAARLVYAVGGGNAPRSLFGFFYLDALSVFFIFVTSVVTCAAALYSVSFIGRDVGTGVISRRKARLYYVLFNLFAAAMYFVPAVNNTGLMWVGVEMTTLVSALLVGFYNTKSSVEAAWKYIIICSVGIIFALLGTILFSYAFSLARGAQGLNWTDMAAAAGRMDRNIVRIAFIFILVGYGTKAGMAPMHTWLPDAHSQAIAPISALLSGVLLKTSLYAILRFGIITSGALGPGYSGRLLMLLGLVSCSIACGLVLVQKDLKRLLAYSSIEHIGIIAIGLGLGTPAAAFAALLHIFNHAVTKAFMFFGAGNIVSRYGKHTMTMIRGVLGAMPFTGYMVLVGVFALTGFPPFSLFVSELLIVLAAFAKGAYLTAGALLFFFVVVFGALIYHFGRMLFGNVPKDLQSLPGEPLSGKAAFIFLLVPLCAAGIAIPWFLKDALISAAAVIQGN